MADFTRQLAKGTAKSRGLQLPRAEQLHDEIDSSRTYPFDLVVHRITGYHSESDEQTLITGQALAHDLRFLIDEVSYSLDGQDDLNEPCETVEQLAERMNVSTKTIRRWRDLGLRWRWIKNQRDKLQQVFPASAVDHFVQQHPQRVEQAAQFEQMSDELREQILKRAKRLAGATDATLNQVAAHLAKRTGRGLETLRQLLEKHDREHPDTPMFGHRQKPLTARDRNLAYRAWKRGIRSSALVERLGRTRTTVYRLICQARLQRVESLARPYVPAAVFQREDADAVLLGESLEVLLDRLAKCDTISPPTYLPGSKLALLGGCKVEVNLARKLFVRMNYLRHRALRLAEELGPNTLQGRKVSQAEQYVDSARQIERALACAHLHVIWQTAASHLAFDVERQPDFDALLKLWHEGLDVLVDAVRTFDATKSQQFADRLRNLLLKRFAIIAEEESSHSSRARRKQSDDQIVRRFLQAMHSRGLISRDEVASTIEQLGQDKA